jgi:hypothetical protein
MEDRSGFLPSKQYRCQDEDCGRVSFGRDLLPVQARQLVEDPTQKYGLREVGDVFISNRVCPYDRGLMDRRPCGLFAFPMLCGHDALYGVE